MPADSPTPLRLFEGFGIEIEEMIVDADTLDVRPWSDRALLDESGSISSELPRGVLAWCNELAAQVIEIKNNGPTHSLDGMAAEFQQSVRDIDARLRPHGARLLPTGMHPWMDPARDAVLWQHEWSAVYEAFDRIFDCSGHGWSNLQSVQINLPFGDDAEFAQLHAAIRLVLPILPALSASTPFVEGRSAGTLDARMNYYRANCARVPSVTGATIPDPFADRAAYESMIAGIHRDLEPHDPDGVLREEWVNARGAIARFDRQAIEIRILDTQECPASDIAVLAAIVGVVRALCDAAPPERVFATDRLAEILWATCQSGDTTPIEDGDYLAALGVDAAIPMSASALWRILIDRHLDRAAADHDLWRAHLDVILEHGCLARRILASTGPSPDRATLRTTYAQLADCLLEGRAFVPD